MPTYTQNIGITKLDPGQAGAHIVVNEALDVLDRALAGLLSIDMVAHGSDTKVLTGGESTRAILRVTATPSACWLVVQAVPKAWDVINDGSHSVTVQCAGQASPPAIAAGKAARLACDGTAVRRISADA